MRFASIVAVDAKCLEQWRHSWPTWRQHFPWLMRHPMVVAYDATQIDNREFAFVDHPSLLAWPWPPISWESRFATQREKMLAAFMFVPAECQRGFTDYWLKIDLDVICTRPILESFPHHFWFENRPAYVAPKWGYSKPADTIDRLNAWADSRPEFAGTLPLVAPRSPSDEIVCYPRVCSWLAFFSDEHIRNVAAMLPDQRLPVPSQDGIHWYVAERLGLLGRKERMAAHGFKTISGTKRLAAEAMRACQLG